MSKEDLINAIEKFLQKHEGIASVGRVDNEDAIGLEMEDDGAMYFVAIQDA